jgi:putative ABC transport system ATP-binding protein
MEEQDPPLIRLTGVSKRYGGQFVLQDTSLSIEAGELIVIVGRSGSGKSTLLKLIGAMDRPSGGEVHVLGQRLDSLGEHELSLLRRRSIGFVFQFFNLLPTLTAVENVSLPLAMNGLDTDHASERARGLLERFGVATCADRFPEELSGGEQQRVAIARAIIHEPPLIIADEPTGNLDLDTAQDVLALLDRTCRQHGTTLIMATHSREVMGIADRVLTIRDARITEAVS